MALDRTSTTLGMLTDWGEGGQREHLPWALSIAPGAVRYGWPLGLPGKVGGSAWHTPGNTEPPGREVMHHVLGSTEGWLPGGAEQACLQSLLG